MAIPRFHAGEPPSAGKLNRLAEAVEALERLRGDGIVTVRGGVVGLNMGVLQERLPQRGGAGFRAKITGNASDGANKYVYAWSQVRPATSGYAQWETVTGGLSGTTSTNPARNMLEDMNAATGVQGNGVDVANLDTATSTFTIQPIPTNAVVPMQEIIASDGTKTYWFCVPNGVDGSCD